MRRLLQFSVNHPRTILTLAALVSLAAGVYAPRVRLQLDARSLIPVDDSSITASDDASQRFVLSDVIVLGIVNKTYGIYNRETLERIARVSQRLERMDGIAPGSVVSLATVPRLFAEGGMLDTHPSIGEGEAIDEAEISRLHREIDKMGLTNSMLIAADGRAAAIFAEVKQDADRYALLARVRETIAQESPGEDSIYLSGTALAQAVLGESAAADLMKLIPISIIVLLIALMIAFRHPLPAWVSVLEIGLSCLWTIGLMGLNHRAVFVTTLVLPVIIIAIGVADDVYALKHYFNRLKESPSRPVKEIIVDAFASASHSILITAGTTMVGLLSLAITFLEPPRIFGLYGAIAIAFSALFTFTLVPATLALMHSGRPLKQENRSARSDRWGLLALHRLVAVRPARVLVIALLVCAGAALLLTRLRIDDNWINNLPSSSDISRNDGQLNNLLAGTTTLDLMIDSGCIEGLLDPVTFACLGGIEDANAGLSCVGAVQSPYTDVVRLTASLKGLDYFDYRNALKEGRMTLNRAEIEQALMLIISARQSTASERIDRQLQRARLTVFIRNANYQRIRGLLEASAAAGLDLSQRGGLMVPFGDGWIGYLTVQLLVKGQLYSIGMAFLMDLILLSCLLRSPRAALLAMVPVGFSLLLMFALLALARVPLGIANSMFAGIVIGIGMDFSIHLTAAYRQGLAQGYTPFDSTRRALINIGPAIITSTLAIAASLSVLMLSEVGPNAQLGLIISLGLLICAAATLILIPSLVLTKKVTA